MDLSSNEVDLHAGEAVIEKHQQRGLLLQGDGLLVAVAGVRVEKTE